MGKKSQRGSSKARAKAEAKLKRAWKRSTQFGVWKRPKSQFGGLESSLKAKKQKLVAWRGSGKGRNANFEGLEGALVGLERLWKRPKSQFWGLGKALEKAKKPNSRAWRVWKRPIKKAQNHENGPFGDFLAKTPFLAILVALRKFNLAIFQIRKTSPELRNGPWTTKAPWLHLGSGLPQALSPSLSLSLSLPLCLPPHAIPP